MEALEFLKEAQRMCKSYPDCKGCPLLNSPCGFIRSIEGHSDADIRCTIKVIEQWSKEHPIITNAQKLKEVFGEKRLSDLINCRVINASGDEIIVDMQKTQWWDEPYEGAKI